MFLAHKIEIRPTKIQEQHFFQSVGIKRFIWNKCLSEWNRAYELGLKPDKDYILFYLKCLKEKYFWIKNVSSRVSRNVVDDLIIAFERFFKKKSKHPTFKKRGVKDSFSIREKEKFSVNGRKLKIEKLKTLIKMREIVRFKGINKHVTISYRAKKWFASILVEMKYNPFLSKIPSNDNQVGVDLGIKEMAVLSNETIFPSNQPLKKKLKKLAKLQKSFAKKQKGSNRWKKFKVKIQKLHYKIACQRKAIIHQLTDHLTRNFKHIVIEDLNISGMVKNHKLARAISDVGMYEIKNQLGYKSKLRNCTLTIANRFFPSSKLCSKCGIKKTDLTLKDRIFNCVCGFSIDRDLNAAINLKNYKN